ARLRYSSRFLSGWRLFLQKAFDFFNDFADGKRFALNLVEADGIDQEFTANNHSQLAPVQFRNQDLVELADDLAQVAGEGIQIAQMDVRHRAAAAAHQLRGRGTGAKRAAPTDH